MKVFQTAFSITLHLEAGQPVRKWSSFKFDVFTEHAREVLDRVPPRL